MFVFFFQLERKRADEKSERDRLNDVYLELVEKQRAYYKRVKEFQDVSKSAVQCERALMVLTTLYRICRSVARMRCFYQS